MPRTDRKPRVAIACQGGGSYAAFAAGLLARLLAPDLRDRFELAALSGTSGGAMCVALAWAGLISGGAEDARDRLEGFWSDLEARDPLDIATNSWTVWSSRVPVMLEMSPYLFEPVAKDKLRFLMEKHLRLEALPAVRPRKPGLVLGATNVRSGQRAVFDGRTLTYDEMFASAAVPPLFRAVKTGDELYWDGLFNINPPVRELTELEEAPDEIWVVQVNPMHRAGEPKCVYDILERLNELAGNLSLAQELYFIDRINRLRRKHAALRAEYRHITLRVVEQAWDLNYPSKLDRSSELLRGLRKHGQECAEFFFSEQSLWPRAESLPLGAERSAA